MKKISRRSFLTATGILTASAALTACSGGGSTGKAGAAASSAPASSAAASEAADPSKYEVTEPITITWWHALESQYDDLVADVVKKFNETQNLITVEAQYIGSYKDINEALVAAHAAGTGLRSPSPTPTTLLPTATAACLRTWTPTSRAPVMTPMTSPLVCC